ncbi:MAG: hypothetical protein ACOX7N_09325 [Lawsonibacter sp.]|jgi:hypothetical protein
MGNKIRCYLAVLTLLFLLAGCSGNSRGAEGANEAGIPFSEGQFYAVAHLGYQQITELEHYTQYLEKKDPPIHYLSDGDFYLVIPRYEGMELALYRNDIEGMQPVLLFEDPDCQPFILQCNVSDIFADATIQLTYEGEPMEFSPFLSLKDGSIQAGEKGLVLTQESGDNG